MTERDDVEQGVPFTLRVAAEWYDRHEAPSENDGAVLYQREAVLSGDLASTEAGADLSFTHIRVRP